MGEDLPGISGQKAEQLVLDGGEMDLHPISIGTAGSIVNLQVPVLVEAGFLTYLLAVIADPAQGDPEPGQELVHGERFSQIVIGAGVQRGHLVAVLAPGGDDDDGQVAPGADLFDDVYPVHVGQAQVQQHDVRAVREGVHQSTGPCLGPMELIVLGLQSGGDEVSHRCVVFYHKNVRLIHTFLPPRPSG